MTTNESPPPLPERLRAAIKDAGISQRELARRVVGDGVDADSRRVENERRQLAKYLAGQHAPTPDRARMLAELLGKPADYFIDPEETRTRLVDQMRDLAAVVDEIRTLVDQRYPEGDDGADLPDLRSLSRRLEAVEATVDTAGTEVTTALRGVADRLRSIEKVLARIERQQAKPTRASSRRTAAS